MAKTQVLRTVGDLMSLWPSDAEFARDIGIKPTHGQVMKLRGSIPPDFWPNVIEAAAKRRIKGINLESLFELRRERFGAPQRQGAAA